MKKLQIKQMENISATGPGQDMISGVLCGLSLGAAIPTGGLSLLTAVGMCGLLFGNW